MATLSALHRNASSSSARFLHRDSRALLLALVLSSLLWGWIAGDAHAQGLSGPTGREPGGRLSDPVVRAADVAAPAVVRIATIYNGHITLSICGKSVTLPTSGAGYSEGVLGSGAFISAQGDILTADHLIHVDHSTLEQQLFADPTAQDDIATALNTSSCFGFGPAIGAGDIANGFLDTSGVGYSTTFTDPVTSVWRDTWYTGALDAHANDPLDMMKDLMQVPHDQATILKTSDFTHDDLAVLHVDEHDTPSIQLGNSANVQTLDNLTIIGFPGNGDANNDPTNLLTPSFNTASVSAIKTNDDAAELIQVGGNIEHGDSGGPALDGSGQIVGVVSFGGPDNQGITAFLRSSDTARSLITSAKVTTKPGAFEKAWEKAFGDYAATYPGHWRRASQEFASLLKRYPLFHGASPYAAWADAQARHEPLPSHRTTVSPVALVALGALAALALAMIALLLIRAGRSEPLLWQDVTGAFRGRQRKQTLNVTPMLMEQNSAAVLEALDEQRIPVAQRMN
ncbi:MAG TPA: serine protease [Ktedonobacterales bacterium]